MQARRRDFVWPAAVKRAARHFQCASTKSHASEKIKSPYSGNLRIAFDVFFDADSESPHMT